MFLQLLNNMSIFPNTIFDSYIDSEMSKDKYVNKLGRLLDTLHNSKDSEERDKNFSILNDYVDRVYELGTFMSRLNKLLNFYIDITYYFKVINTNKYELSKLSEKVESHKAKIISLNSEIQEKEEKFSIIIFNNVFFR